VRFVSIQSFCYCHFLSKPKACVMLFSSLNTHLRCCVHFCFVSKHEGQECLCCSSSPHFLGSWPNHYTWKFVIILCPLVFII
jgi:hypothetical protein